MENIKNILENDGTIYQNDFNCRLSVLVPVEWLQGSQRNHRCYLNFPYITQGSCHRAQAIFTIECETDILGRACVDNRVCAALDQETE